MSHHETYRGIVHGSSVEFTSPIGLPDGMEVDVIIRRPELTVAQRTERLQQLFGSCEQDAEDLESFLDWNQRQRSRNRNGSTS